jgi:aconitate hydratase
MQDATAQMAMLQFIQAGRQKTVVPATIHCDHLLRASEGADRDLKLALRTNREVYDFLFTAAQKYGIGFWEPGSGIIHHVLFENYALPGTMMIGTDSHTPNAGGLGMLAVGVGGADAAEVMAGLHWETLMPHLVGVRLRGRLTGWASAKDVIFEMLRRFGVKGGTGKIIEYFGEGAETLSATEKATITNMGAELGATTSVFVYDASMDAYLRNAGRHSEADQARAMTDILSQDPICQQDPEKIFHEYLEIDLSQIQPAHAGPYSPDRITPVSEFNALVKDQQWPERVAAVLLGSCTNSSYSDLCAASMVLQQASRHGLTAKVPFMLSPGSRQVYETIKRDGVLDTIVKAGGVILTASCGPCIGQWDRHDIKKGVPNVIFTTFNRNFRGRNDANPQTKAFLTSPVMAAALAVSGETGFDPARDTLRGEDGLPFRLNPPTPPALPEKGLVRLERGYQPPAKDGADITVKIDPDSERLELLSPFDPWDGKDFFHLPILIKTRGKTTTDHISPGGKWLRYRGHLTNISQNLLEGAQNAFTGETGLGTNILTGEEGVRLSTLAQAYQDREGGFVIIGDENYGEGSSREHAAMSSRFLGAKVILARSFARIHEANLKKQGILALTFGNPEDYEVIEMDDRMSFTGLEGLSPDSPVSAVVKKKTGETIELRLNHTFTKDQIDWFRAGSALNAITRRDL